MSNDSKFKIFPYRFIKNLIIKKFAKKYILNSIYILTYSRESSNQKPLKYFFNYLRF